MEEKFTRFEDLRLLPGQPLQLEFDGYSAERDKSTLLGFRSGHSLMVTTPLVNGAPAPLKTGSGLAVRLFATQMNCACAFRTEVLHIARAPYQYLHLSMPKRLALGEVRGSVRVKVSLISAVFYGADFTNKSSSMIKDISFGGCRLHSRTLPIEIGEIIRLTAQISISNIERIVSLDAEVRSLLEDEDGYVAGLQFASMSDSDRIILHAYVLSNLHPH
jgi:c-di-GMP-binding flagellar brake protein YcgR